MLPLIDTHAHLYLPEFDIDTDEMIVRCHRAGLEKILLPNIDSSSIESLNNLVRKEPDLFVPMMGLHPCSVKENWIEEMEQIRMAMDNGTFCAVGEIGLDYYWDTQFKDQQIEAFEIQIGWAKQHNLPIAIHSRDSTSDCIFYVKKHWEKGFSGVFHCFSGNIDEAWQAVDMQFFLGIGGVLTFKNSSLASIVKDIPLEFLLLETDSPYLAPAPYRGKRNESAYLSYVAEKVAEIKTIRVEEVIEATTANARKLFSL